MKNSTIVKLSGLAIVVVIALVFLVSHLSHPNQVVGAVTPTVTTNLPSIGVNTLVVGNGCGYQSGIACTANIVLSSFGLVQGGYELLNATGTAYQLAASDITNYATVGFIATTSTTITLPSAASFPSTFLPNVGDREDMIFVNATSTGGTITMAAGTGFTIYTNVASTTQNKIIVASTTSMWEIFRPAAGQLSLLMDVYR